MSLKKPNRREFLAGLAAGVSFAAAASAHGASAGDLVVAAAAGADPPEQARKALEALGGLGRFVRPGMSVTLLPNPQGRTVGTSTRPDLVEAVARMCLNAGAKVRICSIHGMIRWNGTGIDEAAGRAGIEIWTPGRDDLRTVDVPGATAQKKLTLVAPALESDLIVNMPIAKHHGSTRFTGALKNLMGFNSGSAGWHRGTDFLVDSIVDLASLVRPALCILDAVEVLAENGPFGPGRTEKPGLVVAATDPVAADSFCCRLLGMRPDEVPTVARAAERGLGSLEPLERGEKDRVRVFCAG